MDRSDFTSIDESAWAALQEAAAEPRSPFRHLVLCSVGRGHTPRARTLVLRSARRTRRELELHTDTRSPKWQELGANPKVTILGYDPAARLQLRFEGEVELHSPGAPRNSRAWRELSRWTRATYRGGRPGEALVLPPDETEDAAFDEAEPSDDGRRHFGVLTFRAASLDWLRLERGDHRRLLLTYSRSGSDFSAQWIHP